MEADVDFVLRLLRTHSVKATFFVLGEVAVSHPRTVARIASEGHEVACHGFRHVPVDGMTPSEHEDDVNRALDAIETACGARPIGYRAPIWSLGLAPWRFETLVKCGCLYDSSCAAVPPLGSRDLPAQPVRLSLGSSTIIELPPLTGSFGRWRFPVGFALGLRLLPARVVRRAIALENAAGRPAVVAFHPWELDPDPPSMRLSPALAVAHGFGLERIQRKIEALLETCAFGPAREVLNEIDTQALGLWTSSEGPGPREGMHASRRRMEVRARAGEPVRSAGLGNEAADRTIPLSSTSAGRSL